MKKQMGLRVLQHKGSNFILPYQVYLSIWELRPIFSLFQLDIVKFGYYTITRLLLQSSESSMADMIAIQEVFKLKTIKQLPHYNYISSHTTNTGLFHPGVPPTTLQYLYVCYLGHKLFFFPGFYSHGKTCIHSFIREVCVLQVHYRHCLVSRLVLSCREKVTQGQ